MVNLVVSIPNNISHIHFYLFSHSLYFEFMLTVQKNKYLIETYDAQVANIGPFNANAIAGENSAYFTASSRFSLYAMGPHNPVTAMAYSLWFKTHQSSEVLLIHYGPAWDSATYDDTKSIFTVTLDNGRPKVYAKKNAYLTTSNEFMSLNDGQWHHIAVSMPNPNCKLSQVDLYIDGQSVSTATPSKDETLFFISYGRISLGGFGQSSHKFEVWFPNLKPYIGSMDELFVYGRSMSLGELAWSMRKRNFDSTRNRACNSTNGFKRVQNDDLTPWKCKQRCKDHSWCFGYERRTLNNGFNQCTLFENRPVVGDYQVGSMCASVR